MNSKTIQQKIQEIANNIAKKHKPDKVILFGSYAWGKPNENSDVDLMVVKKTKNTRIAAREIDGSIHPRPFAIDIIVYHPEQLKKRLKTKDFFVKDILTKGKILYEAKN